MKKQTINQAITEKEAEIEKLLQQCAGFKTQALECDDKAEELSDSDDDIDSLAQEISSQRTKAAIFRKRESSTLALVQTAEAELVTLEASKKEAIAGGLREIAATAEDELNKAMMQLLPLIRRVQVASRFRVGYSDNSFFCDIVDRFKAVGVPGLTPLLDDLRDERVALNNKMTASV